MVILALAAAVIIAAIRNPCNADPVPPLCDLGGFPGVALILILPAWAVGNALLLLAWWIGKKRRQSLYLEW